MPAFGTTGHVGAVGRDALEGKGPQRRPQKRLERRLEEVAEAVGGGYCWLQMPLTLVLGVRETVADIGWAPWRGGYLPAFPCIPGRGGSIKAGWVVCCVTCCTRSFVGRGVVEWGVRHTVLWDESGMPVPLLTIAVQHPPLQTRTRARSMILCFLIVCVFLVGLTAVQPVQRTKSSLIWLLDPKSANLFGLTFSRRKGPLRSPMWRTGSQNLQQDQCSGNYLWRHFLLRREEQGVSKTVTVHSIHNIHTINRCVDFD